MAPHHLRNRFREAGFPRNSAGSAGLTRDNQRSSEPMTSAVSNLMCIEWTRLVWRHGRTISRFATSHGALRVRDRSVPPRSRALLAGFLDAKLHREPEHREFQGASRDGNRSRQAENPAPAAGGRNGQVRRTRRSERSWEIV